MTEQEPDGDASDEPSLIRVIVINLLNRDPIEVWGTLLGVVVVLALVGVALHQYVFLEAVDPMIQFLFVVAVIVSFIVVFGSDRVRDALDLYRGGGGPN